MNQAESLCHSSGPWKKHKYISKVGEGAKAVYKYAKSSAENPKTAMDNATSSAKSFYRKNITGDEYKARESAAKENAKNDQLLANTAAKEGRKEAANRLLKSSERYGKKAAKAEHDYKTKSLKGISERAAQKAGKTTHNATRTVRSLANDSITRGQEKIKKLFSSETKVTHKSNVISGKASKSTTVKTNPDGTKVTVTNSVYPRKKK